jgi:tetratricopeptide (TPR) repeat protein
VTATPVSPFKFLDAYGADDSKTFFGRTAEVEALYALVMKSRLVLVYGPSGSGKTSLIQCGLANRFKPTDWFPVFVRRADDLNASLDQKIRAEAVTPIETGADVVAAARSLYLDYYRPLYFIFDQFEELFVIGNAAEEAKFFAGVQALLASDLNCKIIISMREEYLALLQNFEAAVPTLFDSRLRVEQMTLGTVREVIVDMTAAAGITLEHGVDTARKITDQFGASRAGVQLAYLQVYLDRLYREAARTATPHLFTDALVARLGNLSDVMADFLEEQTQVIADDVRSRHPTLPKGAVHRVLETLTTVEGTKLPMSHGDLARELPGFEPMLDELLAGLERSRIIRRDGDIIEISHDQLAKRVAERRSADSTAIKQVQRLVRDRLAGHQQTKTWLAAEELAKIEPMRGQLGLSTEAAKFVDNSRKELRVRRVRLVGATLAIIAILAVLLLVAVVAVVKNQETIDMVDMTASTVTATLSESGGKDPAELQLELLGHLNELIEAVGATRSDTGFWLKIAKGDIQQQNQDWPKARASFKEAYGMAETARLEDNPEGKLTDADWLRNESIALGRQASLTEAEASEAKSVGDRDKRFAEARRLYQQSIEMDEKRLREVAGDPDAQRDLLISYGNFAGLERKTRQFDSARKYLAKALAIAAELARTSDDRSLQRDYGFYLQELGNVERDSRNLDKARMAFAAAAAKYEAIADAEPGNLGWRQDALWANFDLADVERQARRWPEAQAASDAARHHLEQLGEEDREGYRPDLDAQNDAINRRDSSISPP